MAGISSNFIKAITAIEIRDKLETLTLTDKLNFDAIKEGSTNLILSAAERTKIADSITTTDTAAQIRDKLETLTTTDRLNFDAIKEGSTNLILSAAERTKIEYLNSQSFAIQSDWEKTIGSGQDYSDLASAIAAIERKYVSNPKFTFDAGTYNEKILDGSEKLLCPTIELIGDTRDIAGTTYIDGAAIKNNSANGGEGTCAISNSGNDITITGTTTNPNFSTAGLVTGDKILSLNNSNTVAVYIIDSVSSNTITLTTTAPTVGNAGTSICILPNRIFSSSTNLLSGEFFCKIKFTGFMFECDTTEYIFNLANNKHIELNNCIFYHYGQSKTSINLVNNCNIFTTNSYSNVSIWDSGGYAISNQSSIFYLPALHVVKTMGTYNIYRALLNTPYLTQTAGGLNSLNYCIQSDIIATYSYTYGYYRAFQPTILSSAFVQNSYLYNCNIALYASKQSFIDASTTTLSGNSTNASPAVNTEGNNNSLIIRP